MYRRIVLAFMLAILSIYSVPSLGQEGNESSAKEPEASNQSPIQIRSDQIVAMLNGGLTEPFESVFSAEFLNAVSPSQLKALSNQFTSQYGMAIAVEKLDPSQSQSELHIRMERAIARGRIAIDPAGENRIIGLRFVSFEPINDSVAKIEADVANLPGEVSVYFASLSGGDPIISRMPEKPMALGSTIKLYVLAALAEDIANGTRKWEDLVPLEAKSYPSGLLQDWPEYTPMTLQSLASLMISISDNTATDQLIGILTPERVLQTMKDSGHSDPALNTPLINTRELFVLKGGDKSRLAEFSGGTPKQRAEILSEITFEYLDINQVSQAFGSGPVALDVEWFASAKDLAKLFRFMRETADKTAFDVMAISGNVPPSAKDEWVYAGFKGGSEPGVLNLTWLLADKAGKDHILWLSWTNPEANVDKSALELIAQRILALPR